MNNKVTEHALKVTIDKQSTTIQIKIDWSGIEVVQILNWAARSRIIDFQRVLRTKTPEFVGSLNGKTFRAADMGRDIKTKEDKIRELVTAGIPEKIATQIIENPESVAKLLMKAK